MNPFQDISRLFKMSDNPITTIDSHTEGESTRLIIEGVGEIPGSTMMEKMTYFKTHHDKVRCLLTKEPRGSRVTGLHQFILDKTDPFQQGYMA